MKTLDKKKKEEKKKLIPLLRRTFTMVEKFPVPSSFTTLKSLIDGFGGSLPPPTALPPPPPLPTPVATPPAPAVPLDDIDRFRRPLAASDDDESRRLLEPEPALLAPLCRREPVPS